MPSGDDGASSVEDGRALCVEAARRNTAILFATPHVWPHLLLTPEREEQIHEALDELRRRPRLELRLGYELTPTPLLLREDPHRYALEGTDCVLVEVPFSGKLDLFMRVGKHVERAGLRPVIAHPERSQAIAADPTRAARLVERGWILQANAASLIGHHGAAAGRLVWQLLEQDLISIVASDGHSWTRPPTLDGAYAVAVDRLGEQAERLFDGSAIGVSVADEPASSLRASA